MSDKDDTFIICVTHGKPYIWNQEGIFYILKHHNIAHNPMGECCGATFTGVCF